MNRLSPSLNNSMVGNVNKILQRPSYISYVRHSTDQSLFNELLDVLNRLPLAVSPWFDCGEADPLLVRQYRLR